RRRVTPTPRPARRTAGEPGRDRGRGRGTAPLRLARSPRDVQIRDGAGGGRGGDDPGRCAGHHLLGGIQPGPRLCRRLGDTRPRTRQLAPHRVRTRHPLLPRRRTGAHGRPARAAFVAPPLPAAPTGRPRRGAALGPRRRSRPPWPHRAARHPGASGAAALVPASGETAYACTALAYLSTSGQRNRESFSGARTTGRATSSIGANSATWRRLILRRRAFPDAGTNSSLSLEGGLRLQCVGHRVGLEAYERLARLAEGRH